jgi:hypothetical protein
MGTRKPELSLIRRALVRGSFKEREAVKLLIKADKEFEEYVKLYSLKDCRGALKKLVASSAYWTHATWKEFLEKQLIRTKPPEAYRPLPDK